MDMVKEKLIDTETAVLRNPADQLDQLLAPVFDLAEVKKATIIATGLPAGPGAAAGKIYFNADRAVEAEKRGRESAARPRGNLARGSARHDRRRGHSHRARRGQFPRRAGGPPNGQGLRVRRRRAGHQLRQENRHGRRHRPTRKGISSPLTARPAPSMPGRSRPRLRKSSPV